MSNMSTFAAVFEANPVTNNVRPARCIDMLFNLANVLMAMRRCSMISGWERSVRMAAREPAASAGEMPTLKTKPGML